MVPTEPGKPRPVKRSAQLVLLVLLASSELRAISAQLRYVPLPTCGDSTESLKQMLVSTKDPDVVTRIAAVAGESVSPELKTLSRPEQPSFTVSGAAQVALARLGDQASIEALKKELQSNAKTHSVSIFETIVKLGEARNDATVSILAEYLIQNMHDSRRKFDYGDVGDDPIARAIQQLILMLDDPPFNGIESPEYESQLDVWKKWWENTKAPRVTPVYEGLSDPQSRCLARYAEWGYADEVYKLYTRLGKNSIPILRRLTKIGDKSWPTSRPNTVRGNAQIFLAKEGDQEQFKGIVRDLDDTLYPDAILKLRYIGGRESFEALLQALSLASFMRSDYWKTRDENFIRTEERKMQKLVLTALPAMVRNPPLPATAEPVPENIQKWQEWWKKNKHSAQFVTVDN